MIRNAQPADAGILASFINKAYRGDSSRSGWTTEADFLDGTRTDKELLLRVIENPQSRILLYFDEDQILAGCVELRKENDQMYLGMLTVDPERQGQGLGKMLMKVAESEAVESGCQAMYMTVITRRDKLIAWYERHGYVNTGEVKPFSFDDPRYGQPKEPLEFTVLKKPLIS